MDAVILSQIVDMCFPPEIGLVVFMMMLQADADAEAVEEEERLQRIAMMCVSVGIAIEAMRTPQTNVLGGKWAADHDGASWFDHFYSVCTDSEFRAFFRFTQEQFEEFVSDMAPHLSNAINRQLQFTIAENEQRIGRPERRVLGPTHLCALFLCRMADATKFKHLVVHFNISVGTAFNYFYHVLVCYTTYITTDMKLLSEERKFTLAGAAAAEFGLRFARSIYIFDATPVYIFQPSDAYGDEQLWYSGCYEMHCAKVRPSLTNSIDWHLSMQLIFCWPGFVAVLHRDHLACGAGRPPALKGA